MMRPSTTSALAKAMVASETSHGGSHGASAATAMNAKRSENVGGPHCQIFRGWT